MGQYHDIDRISIQVGLSGYSFKLESDGQRHSSGWLNAGSIFTTPELQRRYDEVEIAVFTPKCTLVPEQFHAPEISRSLLSDVVYVDDADSIEHVSVPEFASVLIYSNSIGETLSRVMSETVRRPDGSRTSPLPEMYYMLRQLPSLPDYNKILASYADGNLYLAVAQGRSLLLCNTFQAPDFTTAEYFIFLTLKKLQLNPEVSAICFRTPLLEEQEMSLYRYFKNVEQL